MFRFVFLLCSVLAYLFPNSLAQATPPQSTNHPQITSREDGTIVAEAKTSYSPKQLIDLLNNPIQMSEIDGDIEVVVLHSYENCKDIQYTIPQLIFSITYTTKACLEGNRIELTLLESDDLSEFISFWDIQPTQDGSFIRYSIRSIPKFPLPMFVIRSQTQSAVEDFFEHLLTYINNNP